MGLSPPLVYIRPVMFVKHEKSAGCISSWTLADAFAVALAQSRQATLLTGDPEFHKVENLVTVDWLAHNPG